MTERERQREKEIRRLIYLRNELIKESKKELKELYNELYSLGNNGKRREIKGNKRLVRRK